MFVTFSPLKRRHRAFDFLTGFWFKVPKFNANGYICPSHGNGMCKNLDWNCAEIITKLRNWVISWKTSEATNERRNIIFDSFIERTSKQRPRRLSAPQATRRRCLEAQSWNKPFAGMKLMVRLVLPTDVLFWYHPEKIYHPDSCHELEENDGGSFRVFSFLRDLHLRAMYDWKLTPHTTLWKLDAQKTLQK